MPLNNDEKICISLAVRFHNEASKEAGWTTDGVFPDSVLSSGGTFIGEITADKYRQCMAFRAQQQKPVPARSR